MAKHLDDETLVAAAQSGDRNALDQLLRRHYDRVHAVCRRVTGSATDADDATQESLIRIVRGIGSFDGRSSFATWAYRIATNTSLDELRKRRRRPQPHIVRSDDDVTPEQPDARAERDVIAPADRLTIDAAVAALPDDFRAPLVLREVGDLDYGEISAALDIPLGTVKSRIARGRRLLAEMLGETYGTPTGPAPHGDVRHTSPAPADGNQGTNGKRPTDVPPDPNLS